MIVSHRLLGCLAFEACPLAKVFLRQCQGNSKPPQQTLGLGIDAILSEEAM